MVKFFARGLHNEGYMGSALVEGYEALCQEIRPKLICQFPKNLAPPVYRNRQMWTTLSSHRDTATHVMSWHGISKTSGPKDHNTISVLHSGSRAHDRGAFRKAWFAGSFCLYTKILCHIPNIACLMPDIFDSSLYIYIYNICYIL